MFRVIRNTNYLYICFAREPGPIVNAWMLWKCGHFIHRHGRSYCPNCART